MSRIVAVGITVCLFSARSWSAPIDFDDVVLQILHVHCFECHGAALHEGGLRLDVRDLAIKDGESSAVIVPGNANESDWYGGLKARSMPK